MFCAKAVLTKEAHEKASAIQPPVWDAHDFQWQIVRISNTVSSRSCLLVELQRPFDQVKYFRCPRGGFHFAVVHAGQYGSDIKRQTVDRNARGWADFLHAYVVPAAKGYLEGMLYKKYFDGLHGKLGKNEMLMRERLMREELMRDWGWDWDNSVADSRSALGRTAN